MSNQKSTQITNLQALRLSNEESNRLTKTCIESALLILMKDHDFEDISITSLVKRAGVSRTAYYRNYNSKEDILRSMMKDIIDKVIFAMNLHAPVQNTYEYWYALFNTLKQHMESLRILLKGNLGVTILEDINNIQLCSVPESTLQERYATSFWSGAIYSVAVRWINSGAEQTVEEMATICFQIIDSLINHQHCSKRI